MFAECPIPRRFEGFALLAAALALTVIVYFNRGRLSRVVVAYRAYRSHVFTPPASSPGESGLRIFRSDVQFYWDFADIALAREKRLKKINPILLPVVEQITESQASGKDMYYSMHIYREVRWLLNFTPNLKDTWTEAAALRQSLSETERQKLAVEQQPDGSWALGINVWYLKLYYSVGSYQAIRRATKISAEFPRSRQFARKAQV